MVRANRQFIQHKIDFIAKCFNTISSIQYDGRGNIKIKGQGARTTSYQAFMGNAQLASNLAKAVSEDYRAQFEKVKEVV